MEAPFGFDKRTNAVVVPVPEAAATWLLSQLEKVDATLYAHVKPEAMHIALCYLPRGDLERQGDLPGLLAALKTLAAGYLPVQGYARVLKEESRGELLPSRWTGVLTHYVSGLYDLRDAVTKILQRYGFRAHPITGDLVVILAELRSDSPRVHDDKVWAWVDIQNLWLIGNGTVHTSFPLKDWGTRDELRSERRAQMIEPRPWSYIS